MSRNFGLPNVTAPMRSGAQPAPEPHNRADTQRDSNQYPESNARKGDNKADRNNRNCLVSKSSVVHRSSPSNVVSFRQVDCAPSRRDRLNSRGFGSELFIQHDKPLIEPYELGSAFLFGLIVCLPIALVCGAVLGYLAFIA